MVRFTKESLETLRQRIDLAEVLSQHIELKRVGSGFKALCPFHDEKSPSFVVNKGDTHYHCFGCGAHGDAIAFLMQHVRLTFSEAVQQLAERFQVPLEIAEGAREEKGTNRNRLKDILDIACRFYETYLLYTKEGHIALEYLLKRKIPLAFVHACRVGLAPKNSPLLRKVLHQNGFKDEEIAEAGLLNDRKRDFFYDRITFPILDPQGFVIGFSARKYKEETTGGKYINSKETPLFKKSRILFGLSQSRRRIVKQKQAIIVEGGLDALQMIYHGFDNTVAALGTAFGEEHVQELIQLGVTRVFLLFDGDEAGKKAAVKVGNLFQKRAIEVLVASLPQGADPDSLIAKQGPIAITQALIASQDYLRFLYSYETKGLPSDSPAAKQQLLKTIVQQIREWDTPIMVHESLKKLSLLAKVPEELLGVGALSTQSQYAKRAIAVVKKQTVVDPDRILEGDLLRWLLAGDKACMDLCQKNITEDDFTFSLAKKFYQFMMARTKPLDFLELVTEVHDDEAQTFLNEILAKKVNRDKAKELSLDTIQRLKVRNWMRAKEAINAKILANTLSEDEVMQLVKEYDTVNKNPPQVVQ